MPTSNIPLTYAIKSGTTIHLYVVIYAGSQPVFNAGEASGNTMLFIIDAGSTGSDKYFEHYSFNVDTFTDIEVRCDGHIRKIVIADLDNDSTPDQTGDQAHEVPYAYTQKQSTDSFKTELVIFAPATSTRQYVCTHSGPGTSPDGDTESVISTDTQAGAVAEFSDSHVFTVTNVLLTNGTHEVSYTSGDNPPRRRRGKTKNRNHSPTPFPQSTKGIHEKTVMCEEGY